MQMMDVIHQGTRDPRDIIMVISVGHNIMALMSDGRTGYTVLGSLTYMWLF